MNHSTSGPPVHHQLQSSPKPMFIESVMPSNHLSSVVPFSSCPQFLLASGSFPVSQLFAWGGQSIGVSASASVLPMNTQDWSPLGWISWISLQSKGLSSVFSNTTVQKHQFFGAQLSSQSLLIHHFSLKSISIYLTKASCNNAISFDYDSFLM